MSPPIELSVVLPAYLEEENLRLLLPRLRAVLAELAIPSEILVVDTLEPIDDTRGACAAHGARCVARRGGNRFGDAVRTGIAEAAGRFVLFMDADGSHSPEFIPSLWAWHDRAEITIASRYVAGGNTENPRSLIWMSRVLNVLYRVVLGIPCLDVSNSFRLYRGDLLRRLDLRCHNFDIVEEILVRYLQEAPESRIREIPFVFKKRLFGRTKRELVVFVLSFYVTLWRLALIRLRGRGRRAG